MSKPSNRYIVRRPQGSTVSVDAMGICLTENFNNAFIIDETGRRALTVSFLNDTPQIAIQHAMDLEFGQDKVAVDIYEGLKLI